MCYNITYVAPKGGFTEGHKEAFWSKEAAVDKLTKGYFQDKLLTVKGLFEIDKCKQTGLKEGKMGEKGGEKEKFSFGGICGKKSEKGANTNFNPSKPQSIAGRAELARYTPDGVL